MRSVSQHFSHWMASLAVGLLLFAQPCRGEEFTLSGFRFELGRELFPAKAYRTDTADYLWPSFSNPRLNLVLHRASAESTFEEELEFAFAEGHRPAWVEQRGEVLLGGARSFRAAFVELSGRRVFIAALTRSTPPLSEAELEAIVLKVASTLR